jgi:maleate isomerase
VNGAAFRLGFLVPSVNVILEPDVQRLLPDRATSHFTRVRLPDNSEENIIHMVDHVPDAARSLADAGVGVVGFACTAGSVIGGLGYDAQISRLITAETGIPATTTATAVIAGLRRLGVRRLVVLAPYETWLIEREAEFLEANGFAVVGLRGLNLPNPRDCERVSPEEIYEAVCNLDRGDADGIFVSCADFQGVAAIEQIEDGLGKPVVTSNQAIIWHMLRIVGIEDAIHRSGRLFLQ